MNQSPNSLRDMIRTENSDLGKIGVVEVNGKHYVTESSLVNFMNDNDIDSKSQLIESLIDFNDIREDSRDNVLNKVYIPLLESLCHNGMVSISKGIDNDIPCLIPCISAVIEKDSHELGNSKSRVSIVDVDSNLLVEVIECTVNVHVVVYDIAD